MRIQVSKLYDIYAIKSGDIITMEPGVSTSDIYYEALINDKIVRVKPHILYPTCNQVECVSNPSQNLVAENLVCAYTSDNFVKDECEHVMATLTDNICFKFSSFKAAIYVAMKKFNLTGTPHVAFKNNQISMKIGSKSDFDLSVILEPLLNKNIDNVSFVCPTDVNRQSTRRNIYLFGKKHGLRLSTSLVDNVFTVKYSADNNQSRASVLRVINYAGNFDAWLNQLPYDIPTPVPELCGLTISDKGNAYIASLCSRRKEGCFKMLNGVVTRRSVCLSKDKIDGKVCLTICGERVYKCNTRSVTGITNNDRKEIHRILDEHGLTNKEYR